MTNRTFQLAVLSLVGLLVAGVALLAGVLPTQPSATSPLCQSWEHALAHQEQAMIQCNQMPKCMLTAPDFAKHDTIAEETAKVCPAQTPEGHIEVEPQAAPPPTVHPHEGFQAQAGSPRIVQRPDGKIEIFDENGELVGSIEPDRVVPQ